MILPDSAFCANRMIAALKRIDPSYPGGFALQIGPTARATKTFLWNGVDWTLPVILMRLKWTAAACGIAWLAALAFHRFDPARDRLRFRRTETAPAEAAGQLEEPAAAAQGMASVRLTPLARGVAGGRFARLVVSELRLMLKGLSWWWYLVAAGLFVASVAVTDAQARQAITSFAWLWPILIWSKMGARELRYGAQPLVFSCARVLSRQLPAVWVAGVMVAAFTTGGLGIRALAAGDLAGFGGWLAGVVFVPALALALGVWSGSSKFFEALYTLWWYVGPMNHIAGPDFTGMARVASGTQFYLLAALVLLAAAYFGRRRQLVV